MLAIDTNLIVRLLTGDHPGEAAQARSLIDDNDVFVAMTVLLETEWVLRSIFGFGAAQISRSLRSFAGLPRVTLEDPDAAAQALDWMDGGMDFADALHLAKAAGCDAFISFDRRFVRLANKLSAVKARSP